MNVFLKMNSSYFKINFNIRSRAALSRAVLSRAVLSRAALSHIPLSSTSLSSAALSRATLSRAALSRAEVSRATISRAVLSRPAPFAFSIWKIGFKMLRKFSSASVQGARHKMYHRRIYRGPAITCARLCLTDKSRYRRTTSRWAR